MFLSNRSQTETHYSSFLPNICPQLCSQQLGLGGGVRHAPHIPTKGHFYFTNCFLLYRSFVINWRRVHKRLSGLVVNVEHRIVCCLKETDAVNVIHLELFHPGIKEKCWRKSVISVGAFYASSIYYEQEHMGRTESPLWFRKWVEIIHNQLNVSNNEMCLPKITGQDMNLSSTEDLILLLSLCSLSCSLVFLFLYLIKMFAFFKSRII